MTTVVRRNGDNLFDGLPRRDADDTLTQGQALRNIRAHYGGDALQHFDREAADYATTFKQQTKRAYMYGERMRSSTDEFAVQNAADTQRMRLNESAASLKMSRVR